MVDEHVSSLTVPHYIREMQSQGINVKVEDVGLLMSKEKPFLAASLVRIITNLTANEIWAMEIKSPFSKGGMTVQDSCKANNFFWKNSVMVQ